MDSVSSHPLAHPVLYLHYPSLEASPKAISGRTSYLQVRLAYHLYPHLIPHLCNGDGFGPPRGVSLASAWTWVAHLVSCLRIATPALFRLGFPSAPAVSALTSQQSVTRWLILQKARRRFHSLPLFPLRPLVDARFQVLFHSPHRGPFHLSLTVLLLYRSSRVFSLGQWPALLPTGLACPVVLRSTASLQLCFRLRDFHPLRSAFPVPFG